LALAVKPDRAVQAVFELETAPKDDAPSEIEIELGLEDVGGPSRWRVFATDTDAELLVLPT